MSDRVGSYVTWQGRTWTVVEDKGETLVLEDYYGMGDTCEAPTLKVEPFAE